MSVEQQLKNVGFRVVHYTDEVPLVAVSFSVNDDDREEYAIALGLDLDDDAVGIDNFLLGEFVDEQLDEMYSILDGIEEPQSSDSRSWENYEMVYTETFLLSDFAKVGV